MLTSVGVLLVLALSLLVPLPREVKRVLDIADYVICAIFMADFFVLLYLHKNRRRYLITWGWIDFISSIPIVDPLRWGRLARVFRLLRLFRGLRGSTGLLKRLFLNKRETTVIAIILTMVCVAVFSSVAILIAEEGSGSNIHTAEDALWWTLTTMTTVGYGDMAPVTTLGRAVAVLTMFAGIGIFGAFTALVASLLVKPGEDETTLDDIAGQLKEQGELLRELHGQVKSLKAKPSHPSISHDAD